MDKVNEVFKDMFDDDELVLTRGTTAKDVMGWDSLMHVRLVLQIEKTFNIRFLSSEVAALKNVGEFVDLINAKTASS
jgi:acyl carrier protein